MVIALIMTTFCGSFLAIWAASLLWKNCASYIYGFIPVLSMVVVGFFMMGIFFVYRPDCLSLEQYVIILYGSSILYFIIQLLVIYKIIQKQLSKISNDVEIV
ncbi:MAG: hypothetical protein A2Y45_07160 [Tenericutes bacterium GWC2_34_14]|nr:MAG: hypothetical protein A2Y45_07160 [Tenericutes bacterium GWC2_34_14]OHE33354.1 MAG: hypothetical protein A2012_10180 [Tenericutes bacterium GWE2_34_108]OHE36655.1 MAG: hypothetical protein A2Y46_08455 [Tenericutes bacterium GWF1_35_14]OHE38266.1 MAG: hypothetical protein A2Y44_10210 [Tenericutes bacterium GWF2_35_184]OHE41754.1 MAG: hypothetical protein A3K26_00530 [Tenericutes bacterium RIFOXYA12_FULL_35_10]OHE44973.1 MAG: hypothetical protein A2221_05120 [Tenericutes bacterium RIFOXYA